MKYNKLLQEILEIPFPLKSFPSNYVSLVDCLAFYFTTVEKINAYPIEWIAKSFYTPFSTPYTLELDEYDPWMDITCLPQLFIKYMQKLMFEIGYEFDIVEKLGGIYNENYYQYRIAEHLYLNKPIIARNISGRSDWSIIIGINGPLNQLLVRTAKETSWINSWYDSIEEMIFIGNRNGDKPFDYCLSIISKELCELLNTPTPTIGYPFGIGYKNWKKNMHNQMPREDNTYLKVLASHCVNRSYAANLLISSLNKDLTAVGRRYQSILNLASDYFKENSKIKNEIYFKLLDLFNIADNDMATTMKKILRME